MKSTAIIFDNSLLMVVNVMMGLLALPALIIWYKTKRLPLIEPEVVTAVRRYFLKKGHF